MRLRALLVALALLVPAATLLGVQGAWSCHELEAGIAAAHDQRPVDATLHLRRAIQRVAPGLDCGHDAALALEQLALAAEQAGDLPTARLAWQSLSWALESVHPARPGLRSLRDEARAHANRLHFAATDGAPWVDDAIRQAEPPDPRRNLRSLSASALFLAWLAGAFALALTGIDRQGRPRPRVLVPGAIGLVVLMTGWIVLVRLA
ncbi:MAG: hypothetical protein EA398_14740 [Deltaproteobacteria bacterium]|nr:MAG: hypothetical protein EA398_14740 [Deltaproteobacteria bacterium]